MNTTIGTLLLIMGFVATSTTSVAYVPRLQFLYVLLLLIPIAIMSINRSSESMAMVFVFIALLLYAFYILGSSRIFYQSMTQMFQTEEALKEEKEILQRTVKDLREAQELILRQKANAEYDSKMASVGKMAAGVAHEINSPLSTILLTTELLLEEDGTSHLPTHVQASLQKIKNTTTRIAQIISGLLFFSREGQKDGFHLFSLTTLFSNTLSLCQKHFEQSEIQFEISQIPEIEIEGREVQISQVLLNLLNNAFDAVHGTKEPWIRIQIQDFGEKIQIAIENSGPPIPENIRESIFNPFFTTKPVGKGTGIGLSISRSIVQDHGGELKLDPSHPHPKFIVSLPKRQKRKTQLQSAVSFLGSS